MKYYDYITIYLAKICNRVSREFYSKCYKNFILSKMRKPMIDRASFESRVAHEISLNDFEFKDESWNEIRNMGARSCLEWNRIEAPSFKDNACHNNRVIQTKTGIVVDVPAGKNNRWVFLRLKDDPGHEFKIKFKALLHTEYTEFQIAFRFNHLYDRIRFMLVDNNTALFQVVKNGIFIPPLVRKPLSLHLGKSYEFEIISSETSCSLSIDGKTVISFENQELNEYHGQSLVLILFEKDDNRRIHTEITELSITR